MKLASKMLGHWAMAKKLEELPIFSKATEFTVAVTAILERPGFRKERKLHEQITEGNDSILSNMSEGFEQPTDKALAKFLFYSKGSAAEVVARLKAAQQKKVLTKDEVTPLTKMGEEILRLLGGWIRYLDGCGWTDRGRHPPKSAPDSAAVSSEIKDEVPPEEKDRTIRD